jgi:mitochondrial distribution and morphology protein 31
MLSHINSQPLAEFVARKVSDYLTRETGVMIVFESAIVPKWRDGKISFKKTYISKRPQNETFLRLVTKKPKAHPAHTAATRMDAHHPAVHTHDHDQGEEDLDHGMTVDEQSTMYDLEIDSVDVELNFRRWLDGKGLVQSATIRGVRGVVGKHKHVFMRIRP